MAYREPSNGSRPRMEGVNEFARLVTVYGTPTLLGLITFLLIVGAFERGFYIGIRSTSGALLPLIVGSFLYVFRREVLQRLGSVRVLAGFLIGLAMGALVMVGLDLFARAPVVPLSEILVSACFSVLVFSSASTPEDRGLSLYYGVLVGMLSYVVLLGVPLVAKTGG